jgi:hypothetical protein
MLLSAVPLELVVDSTSHDQLDPNTDFLFLASTMVVTVLVRPRGTKPCVPAARAVLGGSRLHALWCMPLGVRCGAPRHVSSQGGCDCANTQVSVPHQCANLGACQLQTKAHEPCLLYCTVAAARLQYPLLDMCLLMGLHLCQGCLAATFQLAHRMVGHLKHPSFAHCHSHPCVCAVHSGGGRLGFKQGGSPDEVQSLQGGWCAACPCTLSEWPNACCLGAWRAHCVHQLCGEGSQAQQVACCNACLLGT